MTTEAARDLSKPVFWGFMGVGFLSLLGGIAMFVYVVPKDTDRNAPPTDLGVLFTQVYLKELEFHEGQKRYAAALAEVDVDRDTCSRYNCRLTVQADGQDYVFRLAQGAKIWKLGPKTPVPVEER